MNKPIYTRELVAAIISLTPELEILDATIDEVLKMPPSKDGMRLMCHLPAAVVVAMHTIMKAGMKHFLKEADPEEFERIGAIVLSDSAFARAQDIANDVVRKAKEGS